MAKGRQTEKKTQPSPTQNKKGKQTADTSLQNASSEFSPKSPGPQLRRSMRNRIDDSVEIQTSSPIPASPKENKSNSRRRTSTVLPFVEPKSPAKSSVRLRCKNIDSTPTDAEEKAKEDSDTVFSSDKKRRGRPRLNNNVTDTKDNSVKETVQKDNVNKEPELSQNIDTTPTLKRVNTRRSSIMPNFPITELPNTKQRRMSMFVSPTAREKIKNLQEQTIKTDKIDESIKIDAAADMLNENFSDLNKQLSNSNQIILDPGTTSEKRRNSIYIAAPKETKATTSPAKLPTKRRSSISRSPAKDAAVSPTFHAKLSELMKSGQISNQAANILGKRSLNDTTSNSASAEIAKKTDKPKVVITTSPVVYFCNAAQKRTSSYLAAPNANDTMSSLKKDDFIFSQPSPPARIVQRRQSVIINPNTDAVMVSIPKNVTDSVSRDARRKVLPVRRMSLDVRTADLPQLPTHRIVARRQSVYIENPTKYYDVSPFKQEPLKIKSSSANADTLFTNSFSATSSNQNLSKLNTQFMNLNSPKVSTLGTGFITPRTTLMNAKPGSVIVSTKANTNQTSKISVGTLVSKPTGTVFSKPGTIIMVSKSSTGTILSKPTAVIMVSKPSFTSIASKSTVTTMSCTSPSLNFSNAITANSNKISPIPMPNSGTMLTKMNTGNTLFMVSKSNAATVANRTITANVCAKPTPVLMMSKPITTTVVSKPGVSKFLSGTMVSRANTSNLAFKTPISTNVISMPKNTNLVSKLNKQNLTSSPTKVNISSKLCNPNVQTKSNTIYVTTENNSNNVENNITKSVLTAGSSKAGIEGKTAAEIMKVFSEAASKQGTETTATEIFKLFLEASNSDDIVFKPKTATPLLEVSNPDKSPNTASTANLKQDIGDDSPTTTSKLSMSETTIKQENNSFESVSIDESSRIKDPYLANSDIEKLLDEEFEKELLKMAAAAEREATESNLESLGNSAITTKRKYTKTSKTTKNTETTKETETTKLPTKAQDGTGNIPKNFQDISAKSVKLTHEKEPAVESLNNAASVKRKRISLPRLDRRLSTFVNLDLSASISSNTSSPTMSIKEKLTPIKAVLNAIQAKEDNIATPSPKTTNSTCTSKLTPEVDVVNVEELDIEDILIDDKFQSHSDVGENEYVNVSSVTESDRSSRRKNIPQERSHLEFKFGVGESENDETQSSPSSEKQKKDYKMVKKNKKNKNYLQVSSRRTAMKPQKTINKNNTVERAYGQFLNEPLTQKWLHKISNYRMRINLLLSIYCLPKINFTLKDTAETLSAHERTIQNRVQNWKRAKKNSASLTQSQKQLN